MHKSGYSNGPHSSNSIHTVLQPHPKSLRDEPEDTPNWPWRVRFSHGECAAEGRRTPVLRGSASVCVGTRACARVCVRVHVLMMTAKDVWQHDYSYVL